MPEIGLDCITEIMCRIHQKSDVLEKYRIELKKLKPLANGTHLLRLKGEQQQQQHPKKRVNRQQHVMRFSEYKHDGPRSKRVRDEYILIFFVYP